MKRFGQIIALDPEKIDAYKALHAEAWPEVLEMITACNITNYSIFLREPENLLFSYFEYTGSDFETDMKKMSDDETTQKWWAICGPMQKPLETRQDGEWWANMEEVFHHD